MFGFTGEGQRGEKRKEKREKARGE